MTIDPGNPHPSNSDPMNTDLSSTDPMNTTDQILEELRPRMHAARVAHVRRTIGGLAIVPLLGIGAMAMASESDAPMEIETATHTDEAPTAPQIGLPDIGEADGESGTTAETTTTTEAPATTTEAPTTTSTTTVAPDAPQRIEVGALGSVEITSTEHGHELVAQQLVDGWEIISHEQHDGTLVIIVGNGDVLKQITVESDVRDELLVHVDDFVLPTTTTTTTTTAKPAPQPEPAPIVDRFIVEVPGHGSFVVEREGETLYVGNVTPGDGHEYEVIKAQGSKVYVGFFAENHVWYGKALITDHGEVELHFWDEEIGPQPWHQWVEIGGVGAAKFEVLEGQVRVYKTETAEGFGSWDHNQGAYAEVAKVDFEGEGQVWFIEAWVTESGELGYTTYQGE